MGLVTITELLGLPGYFVKDITIEKNIFFNCRKGWFTIMPSMLEGMH
jgi:hypothetical protein